MKLCSTPHACRASRMRNHVKPLHNPPHPAPPHPRPALTSCIISSYFMHVPGLPRIEAATNQNHESNHAQISFATRIAKASPHLGQHPVEPVDEAELIMIIIMIIIIIILLSIITTINYVKYRRTSGSSRRSGTYYDYDYHYHHCY